MGQKRSPTQSSPAKSKPNQIGKTLFFTLCGKKAIALDAKQKPESCQRRLSPSQKQNQRGQIAKNNPFQFRHKQAQPKGQNRLFAQYDKKGISLDANLSTNQKAFTVGLLKN